MEHAIDPLVASAQSGDRDAFRRVVEAHSHSVFRVAYRLLGDEAAAEDAVQETFLSAYRRLASFDGRAQFSTWLHRIAVNRAIDQRRRLKRDPAEPAADDVAEVDAVSEAPRPDRLLASKQAGEATRRQLESLSDLERSAFVLRHVEGASIAEIGAALDLKPSATKQAIFRAVHKLRRALGPWVRSRDESTL
ncbi:MAG: sigma-70 family RNA polymerase sigma factor [Acidobacteriota bacterium]